jgi:hypothetical protein
VAGTRWLAPLSERHRLCQQRRSRFSWGRKSVRRYALEVVGMIGIAKVARLPTDVDFRPYFGKVVRGSAWCAIVEICEAQHDAYAVAELVDVSGRTSPAALTVEQIEGP